MDRLSAYVRSLLTENETLKGRLSQQAGLVSENESLRAEVSHLAHELEIARRGGLQASDLETKYSKTS